MNYTKKKAAEQNLKVLAGLQHFFQSLREHGAVIGRDSARIVVNLNKAPSIILDEIGEIYRTASLVAPNGFMHIFDGAETDKGIGVLLLNIGFALRNNDPIFAKFPAFNEIRELLQGIPAMSQEQSEAFAALHEAIEADFIGLLVEHREDIWEALFGGSDSPNCTRPEGNGKTLN
ncbi:MAG: hypothetical protein KGL42_17695 [Betaproteobacteria bacterium]|nr:hypothetical protein [Betaproteobacteria bacterium]